MEGNLFSLDFPILYLDLVSTQYNGDVFTDTGQITMPVGNILVCDTRGHVKHNNRTLSLNVVPIPKTTEFFLTRRIPAVELDRATVSVEEQRMNFDAKCCNVFLLEFSRHVTFHKGRFTDTTITYKDKLEFRNRLSL